MDENRWAELVGSFVGWFLEHESSDDRLYEILCEEIGMTQEEPRLLR